MKKKTSFFGLFKFLFTITIGAVYGVLFARKSGKELRDALKKSDRPVVTFFKELVSVDMGVWEEMKQWAKESEPLQEVMQKGTNQFEALVNQAKTLGGDASDRAQQELENLADNAKKAAATLKKDATKKVTQVKKDAVKKVAKAKKTATKKVEKKVKIVKKAATKKVVSVKKDAAKKVAAAKKAAMIKAKKK